MSVCVIPGLDQAVAIVHERLAAAEPKLTFLWLRQRLVVEAKRSHQAWIDRKSGASAAYVCVSDWCNVFLNLLDKPELQQGALLILGRTLDQLERGENPAILEVFKKL